MTMSIEFMNFANKHFFFWEPGEISVHCALPDQIRNAIMLARTALLRSSHSPITTPNLFFKVGFKF